ncbi:MAG: WHG domain-containing protein, partial [Solirubrobacteraceae bacterium]
AEPPEPADGAVPGPPEILMPGPLEILNAALDELQRAGGIAPGSRPHAEHVAWAAVHGFSMLAIEGPMRGLPPGELDAALNRVFETIERGLAFTL